MGTDSRFRDDGHPQSGACARKRRDYAEEIETRAKRERSSSLSKFDPVDSPGTGYKHIFIIRDLRDCLVSYVDYFTSLKSHGHEPPYYYHLRALQSDSERILTLLRGLHWFLRPFSYHVDLAMPWLGERNLLVVRYEDLVGPAGQGSSEAQLDSIARICDYLGLSHSEEERAAVAQRLWGGKTVTMNRGMIGRWRERFTPEIEKEFWELYGSQMEALGYGGIRPATTPHLSSAERRS